jgi:hypothetical protein
MFAGLPVSGRSEDKGEIKITPVAPVVGEISPDILLVEVDPPRSAPIGLSRHGETRLARSTFNGFADAEVQGAEVRVTKINLRNLGAKQRYGSVGLQCHKS